MSLQNNAPTGVDAQPDERSFLGRLAATARRHVERWGRRYVEMRVDARHE